MPIYEFRCNGCKRKVSFFVRSFSPPEAPTCSKCGSKDLNRIYSPFARVKTDQDVYSSVLDDTQLVNRMMANDPSALVEWSRRMEGSTLEKDSEYGEMVERLERGESMDSVARDFQEKTLGGPDGDSGSGEDD